jgi:hypothetical protein
VYRIINNCETYHMPASYRRDAGEFATSRRGVVLVRLVLGARVGLFRGPCHVDGVIMGVWACMCEVSTVQSSQKI